MPREYSEMIEHRMDQISRLRAENEKLKNALRALRIIRDPIYVSTGDSFEKRLARAEELAREALGE